MTVIRGDNNETLSSSDYGVTWSWEDYPSGYLWDLDMSDDGDIIVVPIRTVDTRFWNGIWRIDINNPGSNYNGWQRVNTNNYSFGSIDISSTGEYGVIFVSTFNGHQGGRGIWISSDYGANWTRKTRYIIICVS